MQLKILSWNIWTNCHFNQVRDFLRASEADIIGLQEVQSDDQARDTIGYLNSLGYKHVFAPVKKFWKLKAYNDGPAIFSKYDITASKIYNLSETSSRAAIRADIKVGNTILHVFSTHLVHTHQKASELQESQADSLAKVIPTDHTIVMGDFNAVPESKTIQKMKNVLRDTDLISSPTWSIYPEGCLICNPQKIDTRLDYIFVSQDMKSHSFNVGSSKGSDHLPISVIIEV